MTLRVKIRLLLCVVFGCWIVGAITGVYLEIGCAGKSTLFRLSMGFIIGFMISSPAILLAWCHEVDSWFQPDGKRYKGSIG